MRPIFNLYYLNSTSLHTKLLKTPHNFTSFSTLPAHQNPFLSQHPRREEESRSVRVSVWWDFENCNLPVNSNVFRVAQCISNAIRANGIKGPIQITAFGDVMQISRTNQEALSSTGIVLTHVPSGGKNSADRSLLVDLMYWVTQNPPPAHLFLISGDRDFAGILHRLRMNNYNILLASPDSAPSVLCSAATIMWQWSSLLKGENLTGKLFNQPPDGPYSSWYGHYKVPLEDPYAIVDQPPRSHAAADASSTITTITATNATDLGQDRKLRPIPNVIMKHIHQILVSKPEGISINSLCAELAKSNLSIDKDFYGYKKLSQLLLAMPHILKLQIRNGSEYFVQGVNIDSVQAISSVEPTTNNGMSEAGSVPKTTTNDIVIEKKLSDPKLKAQVEVPQTTSNDIVIEKELPNPKLKAQVTFPQESQKEEKRKEPSLKKSIQESREQVKKVTKLPQQPPKKVEVVASPVVKKKEDQTLAAPNERNSSSSEFGILKKISMKLFGSEDNNSSENKFMGPALFSPSSHETVIDGKFGKSDNAVSKTSNKDSGYGKRSMGWLKFWSSSEVDVNKVEKDSEKVDQREVNKYKQPELFSKESFWNELESFIDTSEGAAPFFRSKTRADLAQNLQKHGPPILKSLTEGDLLHLVDLLISDKKWVEESNSRAFPFRPTGKITLVNNDPPSSNGLSHIFSGKKSNIGDRKLPQNPPHTGVPQPSTHRGSSSKPKSEMLGDCQKLVDHILKEYPEGFNIGLFRKLFLEKNGYALDLKTLGYEKLVNLLRIMPRARIESNFIFPVEVLKNIDQHNVDPQVSKPISDVDDESDSSWDELGPTRQGKDSKEGPKGRSTEKKAFNYEPLDEDDFSDSEEEALSSVRSEQEMKSKSNKGESSLLDMLDSWHGGKEETSSLGSKKESPVVMSPSHKQKPGKSYSFVKDQPNVDSSNDTVDSILGSLKKSSKRSVESRELS